MTYDEAVQLYLRTHPGASFTTPEDNDRFNRWSESLGPGGFEGQASPALVGHADLQQAYSAARQTNPNLSVHDFMVDWANQNPNDTRLDNAQFLSAVGLELDTSRAVPVEVGMGNYATRLASRLTGGDAQRTADANNIIGSYGPQLDAARRTIGDLSQTVDGRRYFAENPDIAAEYERQRAAGLTTLTPDQFAEKHWREFGQTEGRVSPINQSAALTGEIGASNAAAAAQTTALNQQLSTLSANLTGELAAKAQGIQTQIGALTQGLSTYSAAERAALAQQVAAQFQSLQQEVTARQAGLSQQLSTMGGAITAQDQALRAALEKELAGLNAAQEPLNAARIKGAETLAASVNLGAQASMDNVAAQSAQAGYIGSSTGSDMAIARAAIGGRQQAAEAMGSAQIANAGDTAAIGRYGANAGFSIARDTAGQNRDLSFFGAGENRSLSDYGASGRRTISDFSSTGERSIAGTSNTGNLEISRFGANENRGLTDYGATQTRSVGDFGANERRGITDAAANRNLNFFSGDLQRRLSALSLPAAAIQTEFDIRNAAMRYGQSGFTQAMNNLQFFRTNGGNAPMTNPAMTRPVLSGAENLGAGLITAAGNIAAGSNYWRPSGTSTGSGATFTPSPSPSDPSRGPVQ